jgi:hypothetical protein
MAEDKMTVDPTPTGFYEAMERTNVEKITNEMLARLSGDSSDSDSFDVESGNEDAEVGRGGRAMLFWESQLSNKGRLKRCRENISMIYL